MVVELRKRKAPAPPPAPVAEKKTKKSRTSASTSKKPAKKEVEPPAVPSSTVPKVGDTITLDGFGGEVEINDGTKTTLKQLVDESESGIVLFTYPKASTPGCTKQACSFRDNHDHLTSTGLSIYGLSTDSPKANTTFKTKQNLSYPLLCDTSATLIAAIGFKKAPKGTTRGVFAVDKAGKVLLLQAGGPDATVDAVQQLVATSSEGDKSNEEAEPADEED